MVLEATRFETLTSSSDLCNYARSISIQYLHGSSVPALCVCVCVCLLCVCVCLLCVCVCVCLLCVCVCVCVCVFVPHM